MVATDRADVTDALACFAISQDEDFSPLERFSALERSFLTLMSVWPRRPQYLRAREPGTRWHAITVRAPLPQTRSVSFLRMLAKNVPLDPGEPFLAPGKRFDTIAPRADLEDWLRASVLEEFERISSFSSFFTGETALERLETIASLGYGSEEMSRRLQLVRLRFPGPGLT